MRSKNRIAVFLLSWLASLAALAASLYLPRFIALGDDTLSLVLPWAVPAVASALVALVAARAAVSPIAGAVRASRLLAEGDGTARLEVPRSGELAELAKAFNAQADAQAARLVAAGKAVQEKAADLAQAMEELRDQEEASACEAKLAMRMQRRIVPKEDELPARKELAFGAAYQPAENTGGDLFDAIRAGKNGLALLVADVSGRGVTAALLSALVKNAFRSRSGWGSDPSEIMASVDKELRPVTTGTDHFVTALFAFLDLETGHLRFSNAGHPPALLFSRRRGVVEELDASGPPLGLQPDSRFRVEDRKLEEGDRLLLFTDGLTGARDYRGEAFGRERLVEAFLKSAPGPASEAASSIANALESFRIGAPGSDDLVLLICEFRAFAKPKDQAHRRPSEHEDWRTLARRGSDLASAGRIEEAISVYERLLAFEPEDATALNNLGTLYWRLGRREEAAARFRAAAAIDAADPRIQRNLHLADRFFPLPKSAKPAPQPGKTPPSAPPPLPEGMTLPFPAAKSAQAATPSPAVKTAPAPVAKPASPAAGKTAPAAAARPAPAPAARTSPLPAVKPVPAVAESEEAEELEELEEIEEAEAVEEAEEVEELEELEEAESVEEGLPTSG